jgi:error-prone DNA polymerase
MWEAWKHGGVDAVHDLVAAEPLGFAGEQAVQLGQSAAESRSTRPVMSAPPRFDDPDAATDPSAEPETKAGGMGRRRVLVHASGFKQSPYADIRPPGEDTKHGVPTSVPTKVPRKLWHSSPGSSGP